MIFYFNDLSINGKFLTADTAVESLVKLYVTFSQLSLRLVVTKSLLYRSMVGSTNMLDVIASSGKSHRGLLLGWLAKSGPFAEDDQLQVDDDLWWFGLTDVTEGGLGEAARRQSQGFAVASFSSSQGCQGAFDCSPLELLQGFPEEPISQVDLSNVWTTDDLAALAKSMQREPADWTQFISECVVRYQFLEIDVENFNHALTKHPFNKNVVRRGFALLEVLNKIAQGLSEDGSLSEVSMELVTTHFQGEKAWFSNEKPADEDVFWFRDNKNGGEQLYCSWHGKIKTPQFRLHFQWPIPIGQRIIRVLYLGEKLTKR